MRFISSPEPTPAFESTHPPLSRYRGTLPQGKIDSGVWLTTQLHLDPRLEVSGSIYPGPICLRRHHWNMCRPTFFAFHEQRVIAVQAWTGP